MRKKVLVAAYACEPDQGSEPGVGWHMCHAISQEHEVWVLTRRNNKAVIEKALADYPNHNLHFVYADLPAWARFWKKGGRFTRTYYYLWQFVALRTALGLHRKVRFDLAHHVTFVNNWMFSFLALMPVPFVWGPIGAHPSMPPALIEYKAVLVKDRLRSLVLSMFRVLDPLYWLSVIRARLVICIDEQSCQSFPLSLVPDDKKIYHTAIGVERLFDLAGGINEKKTFRVLSMGRLVPLKGFNLTVRAFSSLLEGYPDSELIIVGKGPDRSIFNLVNDLGISHKVKFVEWLPRDDALREMERADVFLFPTFEGGGMVVLEAMAHGLPIVCLNHGGPSNMATNDCAVLVNAKELSEAVKKLSDGLLMLAKDPIVRKEMGAAAKVHVEKHFLWSSRYLNVRDWYGKVLGE